MYFSCNRLLQIAYTGTEMSRQSLQAVQSADVEERCGPWRVTWRAGEFVIPDVGSFSFKRIVLPIVIEADVPHDSGYLVVNLEDGFQFAILQGSGLKELQAIKRLASAAVLAATAATSYCFDCAQEAGMIPRLWSASDCPGCRRPYCRNPFCLKRLDAEGARAGYQECRSCRTSAELVTRK